jgi:Flp pilus assembly protein protease CpaA
MLNHTLLSHIIQGLAAGVLLYAAAIDLKHLKIRNEVVLLLLGLFVVHTLVSGRWSDAVLGVGLSLLVLGFLIYFFSRHWIGGGDLKLIIVDCALLFSALLCGFATLHATAATLGRVRSHPVDAKDANSRRIAFAPSIAAATIMVFALGCSSHLGRVLTNPAGSPVNEQKPAE